MARYPGADSPERGLLCHGHYSPSCSDPGGRRRGLFAADGADDEGTHEWLKAHPRQPHPKIKKHNCRTVENTGDGLLTELPSVVEATRCAIEMRRAIHKQNTGVKGLWARGEWAQD